MSASDNSLIIKKGGVALDKSTQILTIGEIPVKLTQGDVQLAEAFINLGRANKRTSLRRMTNLSGSISETSFKSRLSKFRSLLKNIAIDSEGLVTADALFLSERLSSSIKIIGEVTPYQFNTSLAELVLQKGNNFSSNDTNDMRTTATTIIGSDMHPYAFAAALEKVTKTFTGNLFEKFSGSTRVFNYKNVSIDLNTNILKVGLREISLETAQQSNFMALILQAAAKDKKPSVLLLSQMLGVTDVRQFARVCSSLIGVLEKHPIANDCGNEAGFFEGAIFASELIKFGEEGVSLDKPLANAINSSHVMSEETLYRIKYPAARQG